MRGSRVAFLNGPVFTSDPSRPWARGLVVEDGRITLLGSEREVARSVAAGTRVVDLAGRMLLPGFQDSHVHPVHGGLGMLHCDLLPLASPEEAAAAIRRYAETHREEPWVLGRGWAFEWYERGCPSAGLLDALVPDRPARMVVRDGHSSWVNSSALAAAGIGASTPDPPHGRIERLPDGSPQGTLHESAMDLVERVVPPPRDDELDRAFDRGQAHLLSLGVTAWQDAWVIPEYHRTYLRAVEDGRLRARVRGALWWDRDRGEEQVGELVELSGQGRAGYDPGAVKLMLDGVCESFTASLLEPYLGADGCGVDLIDPDDLRRIVTELDAAGLQCHFHAIGDRAVRSALDAVEAARLANGWSDLRHTIAHLQVVDPEDVPRFRALGVVASCQPLWACNDAAMTELTVPHLGPDRARHQYPFGSLLASGCALAMGSDWPVSTAHVPMQASVAVGRIPPGDPEAPVFLPEERLPLPVVLAAFTAGSAYVNHLEQLRGILRVGNVADLAVLDTDPFTASDLTAVDVDLTVIAGEIVYERR